MANKKITYVRIGAIWADLALVGIGLAIMAFIYFVPGAVDETFVKWIFTIGLLASICGLFAIAWRLLE